MSYHGLIISEHSDKSSSPMLTSSCICRKRWITKHPIFPVFSEICFVVTDYIYFVEDKPVVGFTVWVADVTSQGLEFEPPINRWNNTRWVDSTCHSSEVSKMSTGLLVTGASQPRFQKMMQPAATGCIWINKKLFRAITNRSREKWPEEKWRPIRVTEGEMKWYHRDWS